MAGDWIKFETSTSDKPEVWAIADSLGIDPDAVVGKLLRVWAWFDSQTEKGNAPSVTRALLDRKVGVTGFVTAMVDAGWMEENEGMLSLPNFDRHNGQTAKNRVLTAKRVASHKKGNAKGNAPIVTEALPREEKRREEKSNNIQAALVCAEPAKVPAPSEPEQQSRWRFPVRESVDGKGPRFWVMPQSLVDRYEELYGELLDVPQELAKMVAWIEAAGSRRKTASGMQRFCTAWFNRQCDKGTRGSPEPAGVTDRGTSGAIQRYLARANDATT